MSEPKILRVRLTLTIEVKGITAAIYNTLPEEKKKGLLDKISEYSGGHVENVEVLPD